MQDWTLSKSIFTKYSDAMQHIHKSLAEVKKNNIIPHTFSDPPSAQFEVYETLGDSLLDFLVTQILLQLSDNHNFFLPTPGNITEFRSKMVCNNTLELFFDQASLTLLSKRLGKRKADLVECMIGELYYTQQMTGENLKIFYLLLFILTAYAFPTQDSDVIFDTVIQLKILQEPKGNDCTSTVKATKVPQKIDPPMLKDIREPIVPEKKLPVYGLGDGVLLSPFTLKYN